MNCVKAFRLKNGFSREQIADILKISVSLYNKIEYNQRQPSRKFLSRIKTAFPNFDINNFFTSDTDNKED